MDNPVFTSNEPNSEENPTYVASRLISGDIIPEGRIVKDVPPPEDNPTYVAYKAPEVPRSESGGGATSDDSEPSERIDSGTTEPTITEYIP